ncbi:hypothetical protein [Prochlorococcus marinus]|uniref:Uncharacterized protein n=1 Tax=Prochlorococcus marinus (strain MIT 9303) TaxID=59922 RepID=A2C960_PROM3|nr:hypothetical protein [Prochlorococcus marinus]ABM78020.1 Hypothetical protein P9303_12731 [Prochlorococcus marinus str. MIT 9303]
MASKVSEGIERLREEMLVLEKYWERGIELHSVGVLDGEEFGEWGAVCMSAMLLMGVDGMQFEVKSQWGGVSPPH